MKLFSSAIRFVIFSIIVIIAAACSQPETIIVDRDPETTARDTLDQPPADEKQDAGFRQLNIGEYQPINSLDPLLAANTTSIRAIQLVYEGLVRFNEAGNIAPAIARKWSAENNDRRYTFHLRPDVYYHDSDIFGSGTGRKLTADDITFAFKRMATNDVPSHAARLFMNIEGFEAYFQEQRQIYDPKLRQLNSISGIQTPNDTTVVFELNQPDPDFLQKLALPLSVIYPKEAVGGNNNGFTPLGSGPFTFSQRSSDSSFVFSKFQDYYAASDIPLNRVDMVISDDDSNFLSAMENGTIHFLPELGPGLSRQLLTEGSALAPSYTDRYTLSHTGSTEFALRRYMSSDMSQDMGADIAQLAESNATSFFEALGPAVTDTSFFTDDSKIASMNNLNIAVPATEHPYGKVFLQQLADLLGQQGGKLEINDIRVPTQRTSLFFTEHLSLYPTTEWADHPVIINFTAQQYSLKRQDIQHLSANQYSWWLDLRETELPAFENIN